MSPITDGTASARVGVARLAVRQALFDARLMLRNGEQLLLTMVLPLLALVLLTRVEALRLPGVGEPGVDGVLPGVLALAVVSTAFTGQAIATGFDRRAGVLRLLGTTPLGRGGLLAGRVLAVLAVEAVQVVLLVAAALVLGWHVPAAGVMPALAVLVVGTGTFVALGLALAGTLRAEGVLALANLVWVLLAGAGGLILPAAELPGGAGAVVAWLPSAALGDGMRGALLDGRLDPTAVALLLVWGVGGTLAVRRTFRWS